MARSGGGPGRPLRTSGPGGGADKDVAAPATGVSPTDRATTIRSSVASAPFLVDDPPAGDDEDAVRQPISSITSEETTMTPMPRAAMARMMR